MAQPSPIFVTPSTTLVQVTTLQSPYTPVILNPYNYQGQVVTILDATSSFNVLYSSIVVSTPATNTFANGSISTLINQPQGYLTVQSQTPNLWVSLNSFPFRNQYLSAGLYTANTSNFTTAVLSTIESYTNTLNVEKIVVSGNFIQSSPIVLNQTVSSLGSVDLFSTVSVYETAFFSSVLSTIGAVNLFSTLTVDGDVVSRSSLRFLSTVFVSGSVSVADFVSTALVSLSGGLYTYSLTAASTSLTCGDSGGGLFVGNVLRTLSSANVGGDFTTQFIQGLLSFSTFSSLAIAGDLASESLVVSSLSTQGTLFVSGDLLTGDLIVQKNLESTSNVHISTFAEVGGSVSTQQWSGSTLIVNENLNVLSSRQVSAGTMTVGTFLNLQSLSSGVANVFHQMSTTASASLRGNLYGQTNLSSLGTVSTLAVSTLGALGTTYLSTVGDIHNNGALTLIGNLTVLSTSIWNTSVAGSTNVTGNLDIKGNLIVKSTLTINTITLPEALVANDFFVSSLFVGDYGIVENANIGNIRASTVGTGGIQNPEFTMDMLNRLQMGNFSTFLLSTNVFEVSRSATSNFTFFQITSSLGVGLTASTNTFMVNPIVYTTCNLYAQTTISSLRVLGGTLNGLLEGDGSLLSNVQYPAQLNICTLSVQTSVLSQNLYGSSFFTSTMNLDQFIPTSTFAVGNLNVFGNTKNTLFTNLSTPYIAGQDSNLLYLNPLYVYGTNLTFDVTNRGAIVNSNQLGSYDTSNFYSLRVGGTLRTDRIAPFGLEFYQLQANQVFLQGSQSNLLGEQYTIGLYAAGDTYVSSGFVSVSSALQFLPESATPLLISTSIIQPYQSTLAFNSTLYIDRLTSRTGINNRFPNFTLDVNGTTNAPSTFYNYQSTIVNGKIQRNFQEDPFWIAINGYFNQLDASRDGGTTWTSLQFPPLGASLTAIATNGGGNILQFSLCNYRLPVYQNPLWVTVGSTQYPFSGLGVYYTSDPFSSEWEFGNVQYVNSGFYAGQALLAEFTNVSYNGSYWLMTALNNPAWTYGYFGDFSAQTIFYSLNGIEWFPATSGGFKTDENFFSYIQAGGRGLAWSGSQWVVVGVGSNVENCIQYSTDGSNWTNASAAFVLTGFSGNSGGFDVVWTGKNYVAVGYTGTATNIIYSGDGITWSNANGTGPNALGRNVAWNGSRLVASGEGTNQMVYSDDFGSNWNVCTGDITDVFWGLEWNGSYFLASGSNGISKSFNGIAWTYSAYQVSFYKGLAYNSNTTPSLAIGGTTLFVNENITPPATTLNVAGVNDGTNSGLTLYYSENGINWTLASGTLMATTGRAIAYNGSRWVAVGDDNGSANSILYSDDGITWNPASYGSFVPINVRYSVTYAAGIWVVGMDYDSSTSMSILYSTDGINWNVGILGGFGAFCDTRVRSIAYGTYSGSPSFLAVGQSSAFANNYGVSADGINWADSGRAHFGFFSRTDTIHVVIYEEGQWIAGGAPSFYTSMVYSGDGVSWSNATFESGESDFFTTYAIAYNGINLYVASGIPSSGSALKWSTDGQFWTNALSGAPTMGSYSVKYNGGLGLWIAGGTPGIYYSSDGKNWTSGSDITSTFPYGIGTTGSGIVTQQPYFDQVRFFNNPLPNVPTQTFTPSITYTSTLMDVNTMVQFDKKQNMIFFPNDTGTNYTSSLTSTFINVGYTNIRNTISSVNTQINVLTLSAQTV